MIKRVLIIVPIPDTTLEITVTFLRSGSSEFWTAWIGFDNQGTYHTDLVGVRLAQELANRNM